MVESIPILSAISEALSPHMPLTAMRILSPGSRELKMAHSIAAWPGPLTARVTRFWVWNAYWMPLFIWFIIWKQNQNMLNYDRITNKTGPLFPTSLIQATLTCIMCRPTSIDTMSSAVYLLKMQMFWCSKWIWILPSFTSLSCCSKCLLLYFLKHQRGYFEEYWWPWFKILWNIFMLRHCKKSWLPHNFIMFWSQTGQVNCFYKLNIKQLSCQESSNQRLGWFGSF